MGESDIAQGIQDQSFAERFLEEIEVGRLAEMILFQALISPSCLKTAFCLSLKKIRDLVD